MTRNVIVVFCGGANPTNEERKLMFSYPMFEKVAVNVNRLTGSEAFSDVAGVCGAVPDWLQHLPTADEAVKQYEKEFGELVDVVGEAPKQVVTETVGGNAPVFGQSTDKNK